MFGVRKEPLLIFLALLTIMLIYNGTMVFGATISNYERDKVLVTVSIEAISFFVDEIGGPYVKVIPLVPEGVEFHQYVLTSDTVKQALESDLLIVTGHLGWERELIGIISHENSKVIILNLLSDLSENLTLLRFPESDDLNLHGYWLYPDNAIVIAREIANILSKIDPAHSKFYKESYEAFTERVEGIIRYAKREILENHIVNIGIVAVTPPEQYILTGLGLNVCVVLVLGELQDIPPSILEDVREGLLNGKYSIIVMSDLAKRLHIYRYIIELSQMTNKPIVEIRTISLQGIRLYEAILIYDLAKITSINEVKAVNTHVEDLSMRILVYSLVSILGVIALIEGIIIRRGKL